MLVYGTAFTRSRHQDWRFAFYHFSVIICAANLFLHGLYPIFFFWLSACVRFLFFSLFRLCQNQLYYHQTSSA